MTDDGKPGVGEALDEALMETHHLANLSGLDEARLARRRLVEAQSATSVPQTRDRLEEAVEYLELARLERRDTAAGFVQARELVSYAEAGLRSEQRVPMTGSPTDLIDVDPDPDPRETLEDLRAEAAVSSFDQLRYDVELDETFTELRREVDGEPDPEPQVDAEELDPETALELASVELGMERDDADSGFRFVGDDDLADAEGSMEDGDEPEDGEAAADGERDAVAEES